MGIGRVSECGNLVRGQGQRWVAVDLIGARAVGSLNEAEVLDDKTDAEVCRDRREEAAPIECSDPYWQLSGLTFWEWEYAAFWSLRTASAAPSLVGSGGLHGPPMCSAGTTLTIVKVWWRLLSSFSPV